ncbi:PP2C family protein-serine/threonine phosphatase [Pseudomarimonas salicorniae]|uniref:SpoIIE family protein phosphatase n=1 Tax=Pseudomarimonas salicorniae TaxID=2933270 RepID=A0ABT0GM34_9GAMM|nr:SpoIIE family protein phosphatase [Lysobacter sp. CAU 1642]MCK7595608.1 SpoIIE family protein phosphatase [Lysobacter sp. CAU 1642]
MNAERRRSERFRPTDRVRFGLRFKIILGLTLFNILGTAVFAWNHYRIEKDATIEGIQQKLSAAARALPDMLPPGYFDRAVTPEAVSAQEYEAILRKLSDYCRDTGLIYLYSYAAVDGQFHTTSSNGTPQELAEGSYARYWETYSNPLLTQAFAENRAYFGETSEDDEWGEVYFLFSPRQTAAGTRYVVGADVSIEYLYAKLDASLRNSILIGFASFFVVFAFSFWLGSRVSSKITRLSEYTRELAASDFQPVQDDALRQLVVRIPSESRDEIAQLASSFITMETRLNNYLQELTETTATKERLRNELKIAGDIQLSMLPRQFDPLRDGHRGVAIDLHATVKPAKEAGGDLYDYFFIDDEHVCFMVGDVSDKGMPAALFMTVAVTLMRARSQAELADAPERILAEANDLLEEQNAMCQFVTLFIGIIDVRTGRVCYANGGHNRPYLCRPGAAPAKLVADEGVALGILPGAEFRSQALQLQPGDTLYLYSDGVTEAVSEDGSFFGEPRLEAELAELTAQPGLSAKQWVEANLASVIGFSDDHHQADDITILVLRYTGKAG